MPAIQSLVLTDRQTTPVAHTFNPAGETVNGLHVFASDSGVMANRKTFSVSSRVTGTRHKVVAKLKHPVMVTETINGVDRQRLERTLYAEVRFDLPVDSTAQERDDIVGMLESALANTNVVLDGVVVDGEGLY